MRNLSLYFLAGSGIRLGMDKDQFERFLTLVDNMGKFLAINPSTNIERMWDGILELFGELEDENRRLKEGNTTEAEKPAKPTEHKRLTERIIERPEPDEEE